ncbi:MAG: AAA family ATPase [Desulfovibrionaceae bacterium]|nr:AAA family ATPase [Desulfovibrionaceae bacterium]
MRILQVRFKNLNSLAGEWAIDLTHPAFAADGIFAITGPTGAGKTTILDAMCLALYGRTPRLSKITKSGNEIMSRQTGECFAEVTFETQEGRFRCHWSQRRARKQPDGELQVPKHEIADAASGAIFESRIRGVAERIESATGMDFDRFTRSMLLAQGGFAAFLQAAPDERAPILEQITGTEIYSRISIRVHERQREEREKLNTLQAETTGIALMEPEQEKETRQALEAKQKEEAEISARAIAVGKAIAWLTAIEGLKKEVLSLADGANRLQSADAAFAPDRDKLDRALRAASLDGLYATLVTIRKQQADDQRALQSGEAALPELESSTRARAERLHLAEQHSAKVKKELEAGMPIIQKVRSLDQKLAERKKTVLEGEENCRKDAAQIDADNQAICKEREKRNAAQKAKDALGHMLESQLLRACRDEKETLLREMAFLARIAELEDYRARLEDGKPCPLCGAAQHPFAKGNVPVPDAVEQRIAALTQRISEAEARIEKKVAIEQQIAALDSGIQRLDAVIGIRRAALTEKQENLERLKKEHAAKSDERKALYGDANPDAEERRLNQAVAAAENAEKESRALHGELQQKLNSTKTLVASLKSGVSQRAPELRRLETEFFAALEPVGFAGEEQFLAARLTAEQKNALTAKARELDIAQTELKARQEDRKARLAEEIDKKVTDTSLDELEPQAKAYQDALKDLRDTIAGLKHRLSENAVAKERMRTKQTAIDAQKKECRRWENLHALIGSADGKKYRNFAQGLTFEVMIGHANRQLRKMTDRYLLVRDGVSPLELNVVDNYQAGEIRSTKNLSGGESFIVSLSLALGLSHMASKNVRVDSLFLDEGFGTLDEEALDIALETLAGLNQDGKLIGVISHVPALKERISTQIQVTPQTGGRSRISGPGCGSAPVCRDTSSGLLCPSGQDRKSPAPSSKAAPSSSDGQTEALP